MSTISRTHVSLRFHGDDLEPDDLTAQLGVQPDSWARKGEPMRSSNPRRPKQVSATTGSWSFQVEPRKPGDLNGQIRELFGALTSDADVWRELAVRYNPDLYVGLFMDTFNEGVEISPDCLVMLGERGVTLGLDIYGSENDPDGLLKGTVAVIKSLRASSSTNRRAKGVPAAS